MGAVSTTASAALTPPPGALMSAPDFLAAMRPFASRPGQAECAAHHLGRWWTESDFLPYRPLLGALVERGRWEQLFDAFHKVLPFGTGGRRGPVGIGPNRMNPWTLGTSVQGNIHFLRDRFGAHAALRVVIAADVRIFEDLRGVFPQDVPNPLIGLRSVDLARQAAAIYAANGVDVFILPERSDRFVSTPELSFAIRALSAQGGLNVSASHNHPDDSGGKFYTETGAQEIPPHDERMVDHVERVDAVRTMPWEEAKASGRIHELPSAIHESYLDAACSVLRSKSRSARVIFTNLHGVGDQTAGEALVRAGFHTTFVDAQRSHDGTFPGVRFRAPNPEYPEAFEPAIALATNVGADILLATDPDADRIGAMVPDRKGGWRFLTGNELSCLVAAARFEGAAPGGIGVRTEVTTSLFSRIVRAAGGQVVDHLLVGCKYIAEVMRELERDGRSNGVEGTLDTVLIGTEESHGFLLTPREMRDKDAAAPALVLAEAASLARDRGETLLDVLEGLYRQHGAVANTQIPLVMAGSVGRQRIEAIQAALRQSPPTQIDGRPVTAFFDRQDERGSFGPIVSETDRAARDVLAFHCGPDHRIVIRPSGTEPKTKIYAEAIVASGADLDEAFDRAREEALRLAGDFVQQALRAIGLEMPEAGLHCSPLLGVDERIRFGAELLPALLERATAGDPGLQGWLRDALQPFGRDGAGLVRPGWLSVRGLQPPAVAARIDAAWATLT